MWVSIEDASVGAVFERHKWLANGVCCLVEGAEDFIMKGFPFQKYRFNLMSLERPSDQMKTLLANHGYKFYKLIKKNSGDTLFFHESAEKQLDFKAANAIDTSVFYHEQPTKGNSNNNEAHN